jgi:hypothetical protein
MRESSRGFTGDHCANRLENAVSAPANIPDIPCNRIILLRRIHPSSSVGLVMQIVRGCLSPRGLEETLSHLSGGLAMRARPLLAVAVGLFGAGSAGATPFTFTTGSPTNQMAMASRPDSPGKIEIEAADDFILGDHTQINSASFTGIIPAGATITDVRVEIYRVFPKDSQDPPSGNVPTRANSPSDVAFADRDAGAVELTFTTTVLDANFSALNSVLNGINKKPGQTTGGEGAVRGQEVQFNVNFNTPFDLPADHYFFIPQVELAGANDNFFWLSGQRPTVPPFAPDLQAWIRNENLDPDWLRVGTDIVGGATPPTFNGTFSLAGDTIPANGGGNPVPLPPAIWAGLMTAAGLGVIRSRRLA